MPPHDLPTYPHIYLYDNGVSKRYTSPPKGGGERHVPPRDREAHAQSLMADLRSAFDEVAMRLVTHDHDRALRRGNAGSYLEFELSVHEADALESLENRQGAKPIELLAVRNIPNQEGRVAATVFIPEEKREHFSNKLAAYRTRETPSGKPKHQGLVAFLETIHAADARSLFTDDPANFPEQDTDIWWEVWLRRGRREIFIHNASQLNLRTQAHELTFVEREVVLVLAKPSAVDRLIAQTDAIAELRIASENPSVFIGMRGEDQQEWANDLAGRVTQPSAQAPAVCLLDSGSTYAHPLIQLALDPLDQQAYDPAWSVEDISVNDHGGHGTEMSGLSLYGDLVNALQRGGSFLLSHRLESVKVLPDVGWNAPNLYGGISGAAIAKAEIQAPHRERVVCLAITAPNEGAYPGRPSSWSSALDNLAFNPEGRRLLAVSAGNIREPLSAADYLSQNDLSPVENPAQAWNVLTVGAYTDKVNITDPTYHGWRPLGAAGDLSPRSRTSLLYERNWPIKPEVVFEGGNHAIDPDTRTIDSPEDLALLTTFRRPRERAFTVTRDTSAATALAAHMSATIIAAHIESGRPAPWAETVRALVVHSAQWTQAMLNHLPTRPTQENWRTILCRYGYGVPNVNRAMYSLRSDVTLVIEKQFRPFRLEGSGIKTKDMILHDLPWPREELRALGETSVEMRVTLSYFVEPNPGERGWTTRHRYSSHGLRFAAKRAEETTEDFTKRINRAARDDGEDLEKGGSDNWTIGPRLRDRGSIHSDIWQGTAAALAARDAIAVYPVGGWWKEKKYLARYNSDVRYALIVSLRTLTDTTVDIYTPIENLVSTMIETPA